MIFREITMACSSPQEMLYFYGGALGLAPLEDSEEAVAVRAGETTLRFRRASGKRSYHFALRVPHEAFASAKAWLAGPGGLVESGGRDEFDWNFWGARAGYAYDAGGNVIEIIGFLDLAEADGSTNEIVAGVAELDLPTADPEQAVSRLQEAFGIGIWGQDGFDPDFTTVGTRGATFIVTPVGHPWLFGGPAEDCPLQIALRDVRTGSLEFEEHPYRITGAR